MNLVRVKDEGSHSRLAKVLIQGFPAEGIIDSGADITIMNGDMLKKISTAVRLKKKDLRPADKSPRAYNRQPFTLDGRMDLEIAFGERAMTTPVYIKMKAHDPLLLSEGVCRQLGIITYHPEVVCKNDDEPSKEVAVPMVKVQLLQSTKILPRQSVQVTARIEEVAQGTWLLKPDDELMSTGIFADEAVLQIEKETVQVVLSNPTGITQRVEEGTLVGTAECVAIMPMDSEAERIKFALWERRLRRRLRIFLSDILRNYTCI